MYLLYFIPYAKIKIWKEEKNLNRDIFVEV